MNKVHKPDYLGLHTPNNEPVYLLLSLALFFLAVLGRQRQLRC
jgi:hypothetical protein